jgi:hypothetical protein
MRINNKLRIFTCICANLFLLAFCDIAICQQKKATVVFGNGKAVELSNWSFVYHMTRSDEMMFNGGSHEEFNEKSRNLYLMERYDHKEGKEGFGKGKDISIVCEKLAAIEYFWNWVFGSSEKVVITLTDGTKIERVRVGPISTSSFGDEKAIHGKGIYLEGDYTFRGELKSINYNLDKWLRGGVPKEEIIEKIVFQ